MKKTRSSAWFVLGAVLFAGLLCILSAVFVWTYEPEGTVSSEAQVALTVIPAATATPPGMNSLFFTPTPTFSGIQGASGSNGIAVGGFVQISGTEGEGLRIRVAPGTGNDVRFLAMDEEVFKVIEGPKDADGYTWWYLEAPYDQTRSGWAAANFLQVVDTQP